MIVNDTMIVMTFNCDCLCYLYLVGSKIGQLQEEISRIAERIDFFRKVLIKTKSEVNRKLIQRKIDELLDRYHDKLEQLKEL